MSLAFSVIEGVALKSIAGDPADTTPIEVLEALARTRGCFPWGGAWIGANDPGLGVLSTVSTE